MTVDAGPLPQAEMDRFVRSHGYRETAVLVDRVLRADRECFEIEAELSTERPLPYSDLQRAMPHHPAHVAAADLLAVTGTLGCLHAWFFHGCHWDEGWAGFGNRIHRADFKRLTRRGPPLHLHSLESRRRVGQNRVVLRYAFRFEQEGAVVYLGDQTAMFVRDVFGDA